MGKQYVYMYVSPYLPVNFCITLTLPYTQWVISNKLNHFRFARIAIHFLQCRRLQAEDNQIVNIELRR